MCVGYVCDGAANHFVAGLTWLAPVQASHHNVMEDVAAKAKVKDFVTEVWSKGTTA